ncbi:Cytochrome b561 [Roseibacterium elongatum DSM 19469]|uniref:Cytochrome b561 n=1 Tax=Roseicyclus elongatus DSM 19469 TaxID=1294273 RepID=W8SPQ8_9RHOB|nr:cytochrome b/b6 domain-containing protein [Roseibacterium elongatum]AHM04495.1 Cytochrome b561 [Roseibacterium elongatum DSM 19469]
MALTNSTTRYGIVSKTFHWLTAIGILVMLPMGVVATQMPHDTADQLARKATLFSLHKTVGVALFFISILRIGWALTQPKPFHLARKRGVETVMADTVHWMLYGALILVPLSGWVHHAATEGFAPIWWPFGQNLPLVPESAAVAEIAGVVHYVFVLALVASLVGHVAGALKHHVVAKDDTLRRMGFGRVGGAPQTPVEPFVFSPLLAVMIWLATLGAGYAVSVIDSPARNADVTALTQPETGWEVTDGDLDIAITQFGSTVSGGFETWSAAIQFDETIPAGAASHGRVAVEVAIGSLTLGSVTAQALGDGYFEASLFPTARFEADILSEDESYVAVGTLTIREIALAVTLPFALEIEGDTAHMQGDLTLDRRDFDIGMAMTDTAQLANEVTVSIALTAVRVAP